MEHPGVIPILDLLTFVGSPAEFWATPWVRWPEESAQCQMVVHMKTLIGSRLGVYLETSWDTDSVVVTPFVMGISMPELRINEGAVSLGPWVRLRLQVDNGIGTQSIVSAWLTPKRA